MANSSGTITALNGAVIAPADGESSVSFNITGTWVATVSLQATVDGTNWFTVNGYVPALQTSVSSLSNNQALIVPCAGFLQVQLTATAFTSGTVSIAWSNSNAGSPEIDVYTAGATKATYSSSVSNFALASAATDIFTIKGSATKTIRVLRMSLSGIATAGSGITFFIVKRSSANSGGTSASIEIVPHDSNNPAATASVVNYTANPTSLGTEVGFVRCDRIFLPAGGAALGDHYTATFSDLPNQAIFLRGTSQLLSFYLAGQTITGGNVNCSVTWTEE